MMKISTPLFVLVLVALGTTAPVLAGSPAARQGDRTTHGGVIVIGSPTVLIGGMPAARLTDMATCPQVCAFVPHVGGPISSGSPTVLINGLPAARVGDMITEACATSSPAVGAPTVLIGP